MADLLPSIVNYAWQNGELSLPIENSYGQQYPIIHYAYDTLMIMPADIDQLMHLQTLMQMFSQSTRL